MAAEATFLPTPSARRATGGRQQRRPCVRISTHALREEGDPVQQEQLRLAIISTHALREEGDDQLIPDALELVQISTHALREEGDSKCAIK